MRSIIECMAEYAPTVTDPVELTKRIRTPHRAGHRAADLRQREGARRHRLEPDLERLVTQALTSPRRRAGPRRGRHPGRSAAETAQSQGDRGVPATLLVPDLIRAPSPVCSSAPRPASKVLGHSEIPETTRFASAPSLEEQHDEHAHSPPSTREALAQVKQAFGPDAVVLSTKPVPGGVEIMAMATGPGADRAGRTHHARHADAGRPCSRSPSAPAATPPGQRRPARPSSSDVEQLAMSTLSFQDYVRERMLRRRDAELRGQVEPARWTPRQPGSPPRPEVAALDWVRRQPRSPCCAGCHGRWPAMKAASLKPLPPLPATAPWRAPGAGQQPVPVLRGHEPHPARREPQVVPGRACPPPSPRWRRPWRPPQCPRCPVPP